MTPTQLKADALFHELLAKRRANAAFLAAGGKLPKLDRQISTRQPASESIADTGKSKQSPTAVEPINLPEGEIEF